MNILSSPEIHKIETQISRMLLVARVSTSPIQRDKLRAKAHELLELLDSSYHSEVDFSIKLIQGGKI